MVVKWLVGGELFFIKDFQLINTEGMRELEYQHSAIPNAIMDTGNLDPWKDFPIKWKAHREFHDGWIGLTIPECITLLNLNTRETTQAFHASLIINAIDCLLHHLGNLLAPTTLTPPPKKKIKVESNLLVLFNRIFCDYWNILCLRHSKVSHQALVTIGHLKCG